MTIVRLKLMTFKITYKHSRTEITKQVLIEHLLYVRWSSHNNNTIQDKQEEKDYKRSMSMLHAITEEEEKEEEEEAGKKMERRMTTMTTTRKSNLIRQVLEENSLSQETF